VIPTPRISHGTAERPFVQFEKVRKTYDGRTMVVDDLDLDVREGEFLTLLGPSGSGKTTCLMMLAGFESVDSGDIRICGDSVTRLPAHKRDIGVVFQSYALFPHMTVAENLAFPLRQRRIDRRQIENNVGNALEMVQLANLRSRYPSQLSGGQQQRVALARALVFEPRLVLMDEPLGALDRRLRETMQLEIKRIHQQIGMTTVYVTHDQSEALTMSDRIAVFNRGRIEQVAAPQDIYERPATSFVAHFVGQNNSLTGVSAGGTGDECLVDLDCGGRVAARTVERVDAGERVEVTIRPERIEILPTQGLQSHLDVVVTEIVYNGDHVLLPCERKGTRILLRSSPAAVTQHRVVRGGSLEIGWDVGAARAFRMS
jgi:putative spermidine/putrescine transport system ATP-binding protein